MGQMWAGKEDQELSFGRNEFEMCNFSPFGLKSRYHPKASPRRPIYGELPN